MKTIEIEAKMRLSDRAALERQLALLGAELRAEISETNTFYDTSGGTLKRSDQGLRIRVEVENGGERRTIITHKGPRAHGELKSRAETELVVDDPHRAAALLDALGYQRALSFEKRRVRWTYSGCNIELDSVPYLGDFVEIEGPSDRAVLQVREELGLSDVPLIQSSYIAMLVSYAREHRIGEGFLSFASAEGSGTNTAQPAG